MIVELRILQGSQSGERWLARHLPIRIGRSEESDLILDDPGVWEFHAEIGYDDGSGFYIVPLGEGSVIVNQHAVESALIKSGDVLTLGAAVVQFWLAPVVQKRFRLTEVLLWLALASVFAGQILLIRWIG